MNGTIIIDNTAICGADCVCCPRSDYSYELKDMEFELFCKCIEQTYAAGYRNYELCGFGDPLLDKLLESRLKYIKENYPDIFLVTCSTCQFLEGYTADLIAKYVDDFKISHYGYSKSVFESVHRGSLVFENVKNNILNFLKREERPKVSLVYTVIDGVNDEPQEIESWKNYWYKKADSITIWKTHSWAGLRNEYFNLNYNIFRTKTCGRPGQEFYFRINGDVNVCCFDVNHSLCIGNMNELDFEQILNGKSLHDILNVHKTNSFKGSGILCEHCDQIYDRKDALIYTSDSDLVVGKKSQVNVKLK